MPTYPDPAVVGFASMILLGIGGAVIGLGAQGVLAATAPRSGLFMFAVGCFSIVTIVLMAAQEVVPGSLGFGIGVIIFAGAGLLGPIGLLLTGASLVRSKGTPTIVGLLICVGGAIAILALFSSSVLGYDMSQRSCSWARRWSARASWASAGLPGGGRLGPTGAERRMPDDRIEIAGDPTQRRHLTERLRAEFIAGAEEEWRRRTGRPMTAEELARVGRYPGDV